MKICTVVVLLFFVCFTSSVLLKSKKIQKNREVSKFSTSDYNYKTEYLTQKVSSSRGAFL